MVMHDFHLVLSDSTYLDGPPGARPNLLYVHPGELDNVEITLGEVGDFSSFAILPLEELGVRDIQGPDPSILTRVPHSDLSALIAESWRIHWALRSKPEARPPGPAVISKLPREIIVMIFLRCLVDKQWNVEPISATKSLWHWECEAKAEILRVMGGSLHAFSQVCQLWRAVALGTAALWSTINLDLRCWALPAEASRADFFHDVMIEKLGNALDRSGQNLLTVNVHGLEECRPEALAAVAAVSHRWHSATIILDTKMLMSLAPIAGNLPLLRTITIHGLSDDEDTITALGYFSVAPFLRHVDIAGPADAVACLPLEQLEYLSYAHVSYDLPEVLSQMHRLPAGSALHLHLDYPSIFNELMLGMEILPAVSHIAELHIHSAEHEGSETEVVLDALLTNVQLPELQHLRISGAPESLFSTKALLWPHSSATTLLRGAGSNLRRLALPDVCISEPELLDILAAVPALEYLLISDQIPEHHLITDTLLEALSKTVSESSNTPVLIPKLSTFILRSIQAFTVPALLQLLIARTAAASDDFECKLTWFPCRRFSGLSLDCIVALRESLGQSGGPGILWSCEEFDREGIDYY